MTTRYIVVITDDDFHIRDFYVECEWQDYMYDSNVLTFRITPTKIDYATNKTIWTTLSEVYNNGFLDGFASFYYTLKMWINCVSNDNKILNDVFWFNLVD